MATSSVSSTGGALDVNGIVSQLMAAESRPLANYDKKTAAYQATLTAYGSLSGALGVFQSALGGLTKASNLKALNATASDSSVLSASAGAKAVAGSYKVNVTQLAQAQTLTTSGVASSKASIGLGLKTTISFQFGNVNNGNFGLAGSSLGAGVLSGGISNGSLSINGTAIATDSTTSSARALAEAINAKSTTTGVTATATAASTDVALFSNFGDVATGSDGSYTLSVGGVQIATQGPDVAAGDGITAAALDAALTEPSTVLTALGNAGITVSGTAVGGDLQFTRADGSNIKLEEIVTGSPDAVAGGLGHGDASVNAGSSVTVGGTIKLNSASADPITIAGSNPALAGLSAGTGGSYLSGSFSQDATVATGTVTIDSSNNSLEGIRDAINRANLGVMASIVSDGSSTPYHLVLSSKVGANASMKISLTGSDPDPADSALADLLSYDPGGAQKLTQTSAAQDSKLTVNGIAVTSHSTEVSEAIQGVTLTVSKVGSSNLSITKNTQTLKDNINSFIKAYNDLSGTLKKLGAYDPDTKSAGPLQGEATLQSVQTQVRRMLSGQITGLSGSFTNLGQVGISFDKDGTLSLDSSKLQKAIDKDFESIGGLFGSLGNASDNTVSFVSSTANTKPGTYALTITQMATQGSLTSAEALAPTTTIASDTTWSVILNDTKPSSTKNIASVTIPAGTYTPAELAKTIQSSINGSSTFSQAGSSVTASVDDDGKLVLSSSKYGSLSNIALADGTGTAIADVFGTPVTAEGLDVAGTLDGYAVIGSGQTLTGKAGSPVDGLKVDITGGTTGDRGTVSFSQGYAYQLNNLATSLLGKGGAISGRTDGINKSIKDVANQREKFADKLDTIEARYRRQYTALDATLARLQSTQNYLTQQLAAIASNR